MRQFDPEIVARKIQTLRNESNVYAQTGINENTRQLGRDLAVMARSLELLLESWRASNEWFRVSGDRRWKEIRQELERKMIRKVVVG